MIVSQTALPTRAVQRPGFGEVTAGRPDVAAPLGDLPTDQQGVCQLERQIEPAQRLDRLPEQISLASASRLSAAIRPRQVDVDRGALLLQAEVVAQRPAF